MIDGRVEVPVDEPGQQQLTAGVDLPRAGSILPGIARAGRSVDGVDNARVDRDGGTGVLGAGGVHREYARVAKDALQGYPWPITSAAAAPARAFWLG